MFDGRIEAWPHGPVVRPAYGVFAKYGSGPIPAGEGDDDASDLTDEDAELVGAVWEAFKGFSPSGLRYETHIESPWLDARRGLGEADPSTREITSEAIRAYFAGRVAAG